MRRREPPPLPAVWQAWLADNLLDGVPADALVARLVARGLTAAAAADVIAAALAHPFLRAALPHAERGRRRAAMLRIMAETAARAPIAIPRRPTLDAATFVREHYAPGRPVVLTAALTELPALRQWTFAYLAEHHGRIPISVQAGRTAGDYQRDFAASLQRIRLRVLIERIAATPMSNDLYLTAKNRLLDEAGAQVLLDDLTPLPPFLRAPATAADAGVWIGPGGTVTPLHHDWCNAAVAQVCGRKRWRLIAPTDAPRVGNLTSRFADVDPEAPDLARFPEFADVHVHDVELGPGELLFVPVGWFHHVRALEPSISVSFTCFTEPNQYRWDVDTTP
ncbi:MAG: cupin-like domain-containing protein [Myxococcales bacterium]|nr:cupin-like domain-containing protein [Myxococcales bacterium]